MYLKLLKTHITQGILHLHLPQGKVHTFGSSGKEVNWHVTSEKAIRRIALDWEFQLGQTYMEGLWHAGDGSLYDLLGLLRSNFQPKKNSWFRPIQGAIQQWNKVSRAYTNISHHYDIHEDVFRRFLDKEMFYSCAYFEKDDASLEDAQTSKAKHIANKLLLQPNQKVLDIGCGWGSMMFYLAQNYNIDVSGITLSKEQLSVAQSEAQKRQLSNTHFHLEDYREHQGIYDRILSIGMFEHVGSPFYTTYFNKIAEMLTEDGVALVHTIGKTGPPRTTNPWIHKYIFPGGVNPSLSQITKALEQSNLVVTDVEVLRLHYAYTLHHWQQRFQQQRQDIAKIVNEEFCLMWEFYLAASEVAFVYSDLVVYQFQLAKRHGPVPITRDYLHEN